MMAQTKTEKITYDKSEIEHVVGILNFLEGFLQAKLQTGQATKVSEVISILKKEKS